MFLVPVLKLSVVWCNFHQPAWNIHICLNTLKISLCLCFKGWDLIQMWVSFSHWCGTDDILHCKQEWTNKCHQFKQCVREIGVQSGTGSLLFFQLVYMNTFSSEAAQVVSLPNLWARWRCLWWHRCGPELWTLAQVKSSSGLSDWSELGWAWWP